ncbi:hypothetical protein C1H46_009888 [Malus baccata]|uniref:Uncharacterized protein n=1 Tax=Malus baccata TaxID=106549 RepID=A0A540N0A1_MALBA|nr:hypothetical protein C1H46_009888 [Malus baccata]
MHSTQPRAPRKAKHFHTQNAKATLLSFLPPFSSPLFTTVANCCCCIIPLISLFSLFSMQVHPLTKALPFDPLYHPLLTLRSLQLRQVLHQTMPETGTQNLQNNQPLPWQNQAQVIFHKRQRGERPGGLPAVLGAERGVLGGDLDGAQVRRVAERGAGEQGADAAERCCDQPADLLRWASGVQEHRFGEQFCFGRGFL